MRARLQQFCMTWPAPMRAEMNKYLRSRKIQLLNSKVGRLPHWIFLPAWLLNCYRPSPARRDKKFLDDILWGQFCLYLSVRIKDDLLDRETSFGSLVLAGDLLELEAMRTFLRYFPRRSAFWEVYFDYLAITKKAMVRADDLQRSWKGSAASLLRAYTGAAILKTGSAAVCFRYGKYAHLRHAARFFDEMAMAAQLVDDLEDLDEDWRRKRANTVFRIMHGRASPAAIGRTSSLRRVERELKTGGLDRIHQMVMRRIDRAQDALVPICSKAAPSELRESRTSIERAGRLLHRKTIELFFGEGRGRISRR